MTIYIIEDNQIVEKNYDNVANLEAFQREMNELYGDNWTDDRQTAEYYLTAQTD